MSKNAIGRLATYFYDMDWRLTRHPRQESFVIFDSHGKFLNACWIGKMSGCYYRFVIGQDSIQCRVNKHRGACTSISGLFFDGQVSSIENDLLRKKGAVDAAEEHFSKIDKAMNEIVHLENTGEFASGSDIINEIVNQISSVEDVASILRHLDKHGKHWYFWKLKFLSVAFGIMDKHDVQWAAAKADYLSRSMMMAYPGNWPFHRMLLNYLEERGLESDTLELANMRKRVPIWTHATSTMKPMEEEHENAD